MKHITKALVDSQRVITNAEKDSKNLHLKNSYASLESVIESVKEVANKNGIAIVQTTGRDEKGDFVETTLFHESGEFINSKCYLVVEKNNMQGIGSAITYARRYSLASMFCITQSDDDGNKTKRTIDDSKFTTNKKDPGEYVVTFGKMKGQKLADIESNEIRNYIDYLINQARIENKEITGQVKDFIDNGRDYLR